MFAIVDIETTGGFAGRSKITEVAVVIHDGEQVVDFFESLVNPEQFIPGYITGLTGISEKMVEEAPTFEQIADQLYDLLKDRVFVAHNVHFDLSFLKNAFEKHGFDFSPKKLCTVRLSRHLLPGMRSYSLGNLCESLGIAIENRHRAGGDAKATSILFNTLLETDREYVFEALKRNSKETTLPPNLPKEEYQALPDLPGVYYFLNANSEIIYVGKAINIKKRITGHFSGRSKERRNQYIRNEIHHITYELTGNELVALVLESQEIKRLWPKYNRSQKYIPNQWAIYTYEDRQGYMRFNVARLVKGMEPKAVFNNHTDAWHFLLEKVRDYELFPKLSGVQKSTGACFDVATGLCMGACEGNELPKNYNDRIQDAIATFKIPGQSFVIVGAGRHEDENSIILVEDGAYQGFGFCDKDISFNSLEEVRMIVGSYKSTIEIEHYLQSYVLSPHAEIVELSSDVSG